MVSGERCLEGTLLVAEARIARGEAGRNAQQR